MARKSSPDEIVHVMPKPGETVIYKDHAYGDRATLQIRRGDLEQLQGKFDEVDPGDVPDVASR